MPINAKIIPNIFLIDIFSLKNIMNPSVDKIIGKEYVIATTLYDFLQTFIDLKK